MQEFVLKKKTIVGHCLGKYLNRTLIIQNILLKWFNDWHKSTKKPNQQMQGWPAEEGCRGSGAEGTGIPNQHNPTVADNNLPATFHLDLFSHFARIHVYVQLRAKTQGRGKFRGERKG